MPQIMPITDLRNTTEISKICHQTKEPIFITKNGYGDMVVMSIEAYEEAMLKINLYGQLAEGEKDVEDGNVMDAKTALSELRKKHFG